MSEAVDPIQPPLIAASGFREYDLRWRYPSEVNLSGMTEVGLGIATQMRNRGAERQIVVGCDFRSYSLAVKQALILGLIRGGIAVSDIGTAVSPLAYFARDHLGIGPVAMVTASHNPNGWTGVKLGFTPPLTHGRDDMAGLRDIILSGRATPAPNGSWTPVPGLRDVWLDALARGPRLNRSLRVVCATGNGTAGAFAPALLERLGAVVIPLHTTLDPTFPHYNPNPESLDMLSDMARSVHESGADRALGFDGDGDRCGVVDDRGQEVPADKMGLILARGWVHDHRGAHFIADVKSTGLFATDPVLRAAGATVEYGPTGHSYMKRRLRDTGALAGFEKSAHYYLNPPLGNGYDCALTIASHILRRIDGSGGRLSDLVAQLPQSWTSPTMSPTCPDERKYGVVEHLTARLQAMRAAGTPLAGRRITDIVTVNGARVMLDHGGWTLIRASSNTPNLVVVCESPDGPADLRAIFAATDAILRTEPDVGPYDQVIPG